jgi:hypothetical protein
MDGENVEAGTNQEAYVYRVLRYLPNLVRDEWVNIGVLVFDENTGERRLRMIEEPGEYARVRRLHPQADESLLRALRNDLEDRPATASELFRGNGEAHAGGNGRADWLKLLGKWDDTLFASLAVVSAEGRVRKRSGRGNRETVCRPRDTRTRLGARGGAGKPGSDPFVLRASAAPGAAVGTVAKRSKDGGIHVSGRSHAYRLRLPA